MKRKTSKSVRKLELNRETVRRLGDDQAREVAGGTLITLFRCPGPLPTIFGCGSRLLCPSIIDGCPSTPGGCF